MCQGQEGVWHCLGPSPVLGPLVIREEGNLQSEAPVELILVSGAFRGSALAETPSTCFCPHFVQNTERNQEMKDKVKPLKS